MCSTILLDQDAILEEILNKFEVMCLDISERTQEQLIQLFQMDLEHDGWSPPLADPIARYLIQDS